MHNLVLSPIDPEQLITNISERVTANILQAITRESTGAQSTENLLSVKDAAQFLNLTVPTIYNKVSRGELPYMKRGKRLYFSDEELMAYLKRGRPKSKAEIIRESEDGLNQIHRGKR